MKIPYAVIAIIGAYRQVLKILGILVEGVTISNQKCYLCGCTRFSKRPGSVRDRDDLEILECTSCGLVFLSSFDHIQDGFYENSKMHGEEMLDVQAWTNETARDDERRFSYLESSLTNLKLLDYGCGVGGFLSKAKKLTAAAFGVEPEKRLKDHYKKNNLIVFNDISEIPKDARSCGFDIITLFHVLEHIPDPKSVLFELNDLLADEGKIIVEVPNADDALLSLYRSEAFSKFTYWSCHLFLFTAKTFEMIAKQANFKINYIKQIQRYPLSNHLYWLANGKPGGHQKWDFLDTPELNSAYEKKLAEIGKCDTLLASISRSEK